MTYFCTEHGCEKRAVQHARDFVISIGPDGPGWLDATDEDPDYDNPYEDEHQRMSKTEDVLEEVKAERVRQDVKWGEQNHNPFVWLAIIGEEKGEADEAALKSMLEGGKTLSDYRDELVQIAATAVSAIESVDRNELSR